MAFRNVIIRDRCKLSYSLNYLLCKKANEEKRILLDEIKLIIIETTECVLTTRLISELSQKKIKLIICNIDHNPECEMVPYQNNYYSYRKIKEQLDFIPKQGLLWKYIVQKKIYFQRKNLLLVNKVEEANLLESYIYDVKENDTTNREGHAAKVYFNCVFKSGFSRSSDDLINKYLNYGYAILLSCINREIKALGYLTELGIHHIGESNNFNLSCDLIEPLRPLVDLYILKGFVKEDNFKEQLVKLLSIKVKYNNQEFFLDTAIHLYILDIFKYMRNESIELNFIEYEL